MEEFSAGSAFSVLGDRGNESSGGGGVGGVGVGGGIGIGGNITKEQLLLSGLTHSVPAQQLQVARQPSITPGLRYRNLGKSGLRVSNIGLGKIFYYYFNRKQLETHLLIIKSFNLFIYFKDTNTVLKLNIFLISILKYKT